MSGLIPRRLFINTAAVFAGEGFARLATALMVIVVARRYGPAALGQYGYAVACASVLVLVPDFGLHLYVVRELSAHRDRQRAIFWSVCWVKLILTAGVILFAVGFGSWGVPDTGRRVLLYLLVGRVILQTFSQVCMAVFKAYEQMHHIALIQLTNAALVVLWIVAALTLGASLPVAVAALVAGQIAETWLGWRILRGSFSPGRPYGWNPEIIRVILVASVPIGITALLQAFSLRIDILVLGFYVSNWALGLFQAAAWFPVGMYLATSLLMGVLLPKLSRLLRSGQPEGSAYVMGLVKNGLLLTGLGGLAVWFGAPSLLAWLFGPSSVSALTCLRILVLMLPFVFLNTTLFHVFVAARQPAVYLGALGLGVTAGLALSFSLTSAYGLLGAAMADVARELIISGAYLFVLVRGEPARHAGRALLGILVGATVLITLGYWGAVPLHWGDKWVAAWMCMVLAGTVLVLGLPNRGEWRLLTDDTL